VQVAALRWADPPSKESYRLYNKDYETEEEARAQQRAVDSLVDEWVNECSLIKDAVCNLVDTQREVFTTAKIHIKYSLLRYGTCRWRLSVPPKQL
jgi:hypothetical protein